MSIITDYTNQNRVAWGKSKTYRFLYVAGIISLAIFIVSMRSKYYLLADITLPIVVIVIIWQLILSHKIYKNSSPEVIQETLEKNKILFPEQNKDRKIYKIIGIVFVCLFVGILLFIGIGTLFFM